MDKHYFRVINDNIFSIKADVLAFSANPLPMTTTGKLDTAVFLLAGRDELLSEREKHGMLDYGDLLVTESYNLSDRYKWLFHIVTPMNMGDAYGEIGILGEAYKTCLRKANELRAYSIVFPLMGSDALQFSDVEAFDIAKRAINEIAPTLRPMEILIAVPDKNEIINIDRYENFTIDYVRKKMEHWRKIKDFYSDEDEQGTLDDGMEILVHQQMIRRRIRERSLNEIISREIANKKKDYLDSNLNKTEKDFALEKIAEVINAWIIETKDDYSGKRYERTLRSAAELAKEIDASPSTVSKLANAKGSLPSRDMLISLAIGMRLEREDRIRFVLYGNEKLNYPQNSKEELIEDILGNDKEKHDFLSVNTKVYEMTKKTIRKGTKHSKSISAKKKSPAKSNGKDNKSI